MDDVTARFSPDYRTARARFREATAAVPHGSLPVLDDADGDYTIDWAITGDPDARDLLVYSSGLHGVEGYAGSAAQLELLAAASSGAPGPATLWLHALNPWGMAHIRRFNERNVDLNRNFLPPGRPYQGDDSTYAKVDALLNPQTPPGFELFYLRVGLVVAQHGYQTLKNAVVGGQNLNPKGIFYGGAELEAGPKVLLPFLEQTLGGRRRVVHVDLHTGLGPHGGRTLLLEGEATPERVARVRSGFGPEVKAWDASNKDAYEIRGGMMSEVQRRLVGVDYDGLTCEFGTWPNLKVLIALRAENRQHHWGGAPVGPEHPAKQQLREAFVPAATEWRAGVLRHAREVQAQAARLLAAG